MPEHCSRDGVGTLGHLMRGMGRLHPRASHKGMGRLSSSGISSRYRSIVVIPVGGIGGDGDGRFEYDCGPGAILYA